MDRQQIGNALHSLHGRASSRLRNAAKTYDHFHDQVLEGSMYLLDCVDRINRKRTLSSGGVLKRRRLSENLGSIDVEDKKFQVQEELSTIQSKIQTLFSLAESRRPVQDQKAESSSETNSSNVCSDNFILWEKLMEDEMIIFKRKKKARKSNNLMMYVG